MKCSSKFIAIILLLIPFLNIAQENLEIDYKVKIVVDLDTLKGPEDFKQVFSNAIDKSELLTFKLKINNKENKTIFNKLKMLDPSFTKLDDLVINQIIQIEGNYYTYQNDIIHSYNLLGTDFNVQINNIISWKITKEIKKINDYECLKAIGSVKYGKLKGKTITAWFSKMIPLPYGPKIYNSLPGLVLEVHEPNAIIYAENIKILEKPIKIDIPSKDELISAEDAEKKTQKLDEKAEQFLRQ
ncbi:GLPGLI family protein [Winogradskyella wichelsiae]|uniref:GLPGLI family protein n=1 Tax=Winogradskyella wichelsiae TaxID=2697007 RepID=UPI0015C8876A|nr:GLPGLI family protein [Winogradskyella wichelsiae]